MTAPPDTNTNPTIELVVLVTFRSADVIGPLVSSVARWLGDRPAGRFVVVDNSGSQETIDIVEDLTSAHSDRVHATVSPANVGFAPGVNAAVGAARERWGIPSTIVLVNPDVSTDPAVLSGVVDVLDDPAVGIAAPMLLDGTGTRADRGIARRFWNRRRLFAEVVGVPGLTAALASPARNIVVRPAEGVVDVDITSGAFMAIRATLFGDGLDTRLPMYLEDQEICHRAARQGLRVVVATDLVAHHVGGVSRKSNTAMTRQLRMMELATAPCLSLADTAGRSRVQLRTVVGLGGAVRTALSAAVLCTAGVFSGSAREWARGQLDLGRWFVSWAGSRTSLDGAIGWPAP